MVKSYKGLLKKYNGLPKDTRWYFSHLDKLISPEFPYKVPLSFGFSLIEEGEKTCLYAGIVKKHRVDKDLARSAVDSRRMNRENYQKYFEIIFDRPIPATTWDLIAKATKTRNMVMHGNSNVTDPDQRNAISYMLDYADKMNKHLIKTEGFTPFGKMSGFAGAGKSLDNSTSRWVLKGMGLLN